MQLDLRALDRREEILPEKRHQRERSEDGDQEADDEQSARAERGHQQAAVEGARAPRTDARSRAERA